MFLSDNADMLKTLQNIYNLQDPLSSLKWFYGKKISRQLKPMIIIQICSMNELMNQWNHLFSVKQHKNYKNCIKCIKLE